MTDEKFRYDKMLRSQQWARKRSEILKRDGCCRSCGSSNNLQVHHRQYHTRKVTGTYLAPWKYNSKYLIALCGHCHLKGHKLYKVPVKFI